MKPDSTKKIKREADVERILVEGVRKLGGIAYKFVSPGNTGVPDRLIVLQGGVVWFVELKTEVGRLSEPQKAQIKRLHLLGCNSAVLYGEKDVRAFLTALREEVISP